MKAVYLEKDAVNPGDVSFQPLCDVVPDTTFYDNTDENDKWAKLEGAEIVFTNKVVMDEKVFEKFPMIRYIGVCATGYNVVDTKAARARGITVTNVPAYSTESVAQHTFALLLEIASMPGIHDRSVKAGDWVKSKTFCYWKDTVMELSGKTMGIFGFGNIGKRVAQIANAFGMNVLVYTAHPDKYKNHASDRLKFVDCKTLYAESDVISFHCPQTEETAGIINSENINKMKQGVIIINVSRGGLANEAELAIELERGRVRAYAADVVKSEPMAADNPLLKAPNTIITPHIAWASREARMRLIDVIAGNVDGWLKGKSVNVVD